MAKRSSTTASIRVPTVGAVAMIAAAAVIATVRFSLRQIASHCFLPPTATAPTSTAVSFAIILG